MVNSKHLEFVEITNPNRKTKLWVVVSKSSGVGLGVIGWHSPWRQYVFEPEREYITIHAQSCLRDVADFLKLQNEAHAQEIRNRKANA